MQETQSQNHFSLRKVAQRIRVPAGFLLAPLLLVAANPLPQSLVTGAIVSLLGLSIRAWASGYVKKNQELTTTGPYAHTRNPLYLGTFIMALGVALSTTSLWFLAVFVALYLLIYVPVMMAEADTLDRLFPIEFASYRSRVPMFLPRLRPVETEGIKVMGKPGFSFAQYLKHREYRAAAGLLIIYALLALKLFLQ
jgi:protein-S-isoprenylcysteine O-methyltransferase Ste14